MTYPIEGTCQCGNITYQLLAKPIKVIACHCHECQKLSTGPFSITTVVKQSDIVFSGEMNEWSRMSDSGNKNHAKFCPVCGNRIYHYNPAAPDPIKLKLKPVNPSDPSVLQPTEHIWVSQKQAWVTLPDDVPQCQNQNF